MLHELLLALLGYTGDLIVDEREHQQNLRIQLSPDAPISEECTFKLASDISFIQPSERDVIERLIKLGIYYRELDRFATKSRNLSWIRSFSESPTSRISEFSKGKKDKQSVYKRAVANGIIEILSVYRSAVLHIEQKLLSDSLPILATVTQGLNKFFVLLPPLYELILEIERDGYSGGRLLNLLHKRCHCGVPELQTCVQRLLWHGHQVLYNQLASWMVYGILHDQYGEFFISRQENRDLEDDSATDVIEKLKYLSTSDTSLTDWHSGFHVALDMLPEYITMQVAESILFAGKAVRILRNPSPTIQFPNAPSHQQISKGSKGAQGYTVQTSSSKDSIGDELLPQTDANKIESMLQALKESSEFHKRSFESAIDSIRAIAASHLWQLVVIRADLNGHLKALKDYFLLAKGDFFQSFLEESRQLMRLPPRQSSAEADLMVPFQLASIKTIGDEDRYFSRVSLRMPSFGLPLKSSQVDSSKTKVPGDGDSGASETSLGKMLDGWDGITLEYSVDWPLHLFFTQEILSKYRRIFQYLLRLKRTQMELEKSWASAMNQDHSEFAKHRNDPKGCSVSQQRRQCFRPMWRVREHMAFLIRNLQFYIQVDVIESQWNVLQSHIQNSHDFTELVGFHQESMLSACHKSLSSSSCNATCSRLIKLYLSALISQSFLDIGSVSRILDGIMKLCLQFCWKIESQGSNESTVELEQITEEFNKKSNSLYTILRSSRLAGSQRAPFLRRFLLRLNFNSFFEVTARGVLNVVRPRPSLTVLQ